MHIFFLLEVFIFYSRLNLKLNQEKKIFYVLLKFNFVILSCAYLISNIILWVYIFYIYYIIVIFLANKHLKI